MNPSLLLQLYTQRDPKNRKKGKKEMYWMWEEKFLAGEMLKELECSLCM